MVVWLLDDEGKPTKLVDRYEPYFYASGGREGLRLLRGSLSRIKVPIRTEWAEALLDERRLRQEGFLSPGPIREKWREHLSGRRNWQHHLWSVLMFQTWLDAQ